MNNIDVRQRTSCTYYETIGGGQGAWLDADGPAGVHVAMSNALATPVEALEVAYPLRVERSRCGSDRAAPACTAAVTASIREVRVLEACRLSVLGERRRHRAARSPTAGRTARRAGTLVDGEEIPGKDTRQLEAGQVVRVETPGGGGYGTPPNDPSLASSLISRRR